MLRLIVLLAFFASGASSLMLEVVWSKELSHLLGSSFEAITTVVAAYLFGLALGAGLSGRSERLARRPVLAYGLLEIGIGLFGWISIPLIRSLDGALGLAYSGLGGDSAGYAVVRFLVAFALLLIPTTLMGATLPVLVAWGTKRADLARVLGTLYAINTSGAVAGTLIAGFILLPTVGLTNTALIGGSLSIAVGLAMWRASIGLKESATAPAHAADPESAPASAKKRPAAAQPVLAVAGDASHARLMLAFFAISGMVSLACQIAWSRLAATLLGSSVYSFTLVLATFLVGIAAGSAILVPVLARRPATWRMFAVLQWIAAAGILYASLRIADAPWSLLDAIASSQGRVGAMWLRESLILAGVMFPACVCFGALFPLATRLSAFPGDTPAHTAGRAYGWNTLGTVTGSLATGFLLVQLIGTRATLLSAAGLAVLIGVAAWFLAPRPAARASTIPEGAPIGRLAAPAAALASFVMAITFMPSWDRGLLAMGVFRPLMTSTAGGSIDPAQARANLRERMSQEEMIWSKEGRLATVTVHRARADHSTIALRVNGKTDASTGADMLTQLLAGQLPMFWAPDSARTLVVGYGSGVTVWGALAHEPKSLDVVEIEPAVLEADRFFQSVNGKPLQNPRTTAHIEDARAFVGNVKKQYDVIISEPSNPWIAGVNDLFTVDYFEAVKKRLAPDGVFCQWTQYYEMSKSTLASILRSLHSVFPNAEVFIVQRDVLVVATANGRPLDLARVEEKLGRPLVQQSFARTQMRTVADLVALHRNSLSEVVARLPEAPFNTDDRPFVEYRAPIDLYQVSPNQLPIDEGSLLPADVVEDLSRWTTGADPVELASQVASGLMMQGQLAKGSVWIAALSKASPERGKELEASAQTVIRARDQQARLLQARQMLDANDLNGARQMLDGMLAELPGLRPALIDRGRLAMREDSLDRAKSLLLRGLDGASPAEEYDAACNLGIIAMRQNRMQEGLERFAQATRALPTQNGGYLYHARALTQLGRAHEAQAVLEAGLTKATDTAPILEARNALLSARPN